MTQPKTNRFAPYTINMAVSGLSGFTAPFAQVLNSYSSYFKDKCVWPAICDQVHEAVAACGLDVQTNPLRKATSEQRSDRDQLIACIKELRNRIDPLYIPLPMLNTARTVYRPYKDSKLTLDDELRDLLLRLHHIQKLFEPIVILTPKETNPGKPELKQLKKKIENIFDTFAKDSSIKKSVKIDAKANFVQDVLLVFNLRNETK
ncbi:hypothetical protein [Herminiimonas sp. CN]|uniref:hypothetical protein n=1 Tax=Herminiimonas sp. CN TaxID=1349818 RepID=UPI000473B19B|nr:hypothetical protein [Herminiimonas sp. CN]